VLGGVLLANLALGMPREESGSQLAHARMQKSKKAREKSRAFAF
jgi:hypothetical protein